MYHKGEAMPATATVHIRVDEKVKEKATTALAAMGLSLSDVVRILLVRVAAEKALPFDIKVPNSETRAAREAAERGEVARFDSVEALMADLNADD
jgi:DNA-damage-inducible protein J